MDWWKAINIGLYVILKIKTFIETGVTQFSFDVSYKGQVYTANVNLSKKTQWSKINKMF